MVTTPTKPGVEEDGGLVRVPVPSWRPAAREDSTFPAKESHPRELRPFGADALQALLAFSALHQQVRQRRALAARSKNFDAAPSTRFEAEFEIDEQFVLDEVLQLVADRAIAITGADGLGIALAENNEIVLRASAGTLKPDVGARIQRDSAFSGACFRTAQIIRCDDTETDDRVNLYACRQLGARSMVAVPLCGRRRVIGLLEAFSAEPFGFNDSDVASLELLAELILAALKPEDEDRFAESAQAAEEQLDAPAEPQSPAVPSAATSRSEAAAKSKDGFSVVPILEASESSHQRDRVPEPPIHENLTGALVLSPAEQATSEREDVQSSAEISPPTNRHPGVLLVLALVVLAALLGGALWWKLNNAQLSSISLKSSERLPSKPEATATQSAAPTTVPSPAVTSSSLAATSAPSDHTDSTTEQTADDSNEPNAQSGAASTSQELSRMPHITGIRHWSSADSSTVVLDLEDQVQYEAHRLANPDRIYFDLHDTSLATDLAGKTIEVGDPLLARVRVAQPVSGLTRIVLETKGNSNYSVSLEPNPYRLVVQVRKLGADSKSQVNLFPGTDAPAKLAIVVPPPTKEDLQLRARVPKLRIVVDAGHGGWDLGTVGRRGLLEKDLVLEIAQRLGKLLESRLGANVLLTRNDDNYIPLDERAGMANQAQADLFVSVHANYSDLPSARGVETYYTNFFSAPSAKDMETRAVSSGSASAAAPIPAALSASELHDKIEQSRRLAASVQRSLYGTLSSQNPGLRDRGVKEASYVVLTETAMPGILAEVSFVSSPTDEQKLRSDGYREQIAEALYKGIARYAAARSVKVASAKH